MSVSPTAARLVAALDGLTIEAQDEFARWLDEVEIEADLPGHDELEQMIRRAAAIPQTRGQRGEGL